MPPAHARIIQDEVRRGPLPIRRNGQSETVSVTLTVASTYTLAAAGTVGTLETFTLTALANAPPGGALGDINLVGNSPFGNMTNTAVYNLQGNSITLSPAPTRRTDTTLLWTAPWSWGRSSLSRRPGS